MTAVDERARYVAQLERARKANDPAWVARLERKLADLESRSGLERPEDR